ncbi:hypothetical protein BKA62DRAFT_830587 [Auriculariales sp. MPI-PUGE-AT-0066]|nr:hypothetical protein BKA62DRAFT_830587 [Auriculariales sp. MPI-PUGE-AT-0066]
MYSRFFVAAVVFASSVFASPTSLRLREPAPEGNGHFDIELNGNIYPPPVLEANLPQNVKIDCINCKVKGEFALSAGGQDVFQDRTPSENFTSKFVQAENFDFTNTWVGLAVQSFSAHLEFAVTITPAVNDTVGNELIIHVLSAPIKIPILAVPGLSVEIDPQIHGSINVSKEVTFTHGFDMTVPTGSTLLIPVFHPNETIAVGFNQTVTKTTDFQSSSDDLEMMFELSLRNSASISLDVLGKTLTFGVFEDIPKVGVTVTQITNAAGDCSAVPINAGGSVPLVQSFPKLTKITPSIGFDYNLKFNDLVFTPIDFAIPFKTSVAPTCLQFDPIQSMLVVPGSVNNRTVNVGDVPDAGGAAVGLRASGALVASIAAVLAFMF